MANPKTKKPKFFCQYCDAEVGQFDKKCSSCGRFFASVNCANCNFTGASELFSNGCPICGYAAFSESPKNKTKHKTKKNNQQKKLNLKQAIFFNSRKKPTKDVDPLPLWLILLPFLALLVLIAIIILGK